MTDVYFNASIFSVLSPYSYLSAILAAERSSVSPGDAHVAIVMAHIAVEGFFSELAVHLEQFETEDTSLMAAGHILGQLEISRVQLAEKVKISHQLMFSSPLDLGAEPYQGFALLVKLRNEIAHPKRQRSPKWFDYFVRNDLILCPARPGTIPLQWNQQFQNVHCARWACRAARGIVAHFLTHLPHRLCTELIRDSWAPLLSDARVDEPSVRISDAENNS